MDQLPLSERVVSCFTVSSGVAGVFLSLVSELLAAELSSDASSLDAGDCVGCWIVVVVVSGCSDEAGSCAVVF